MTNSAERRERLMPDGQPRWLRVYDNGGGHKYFCRKCSAFSLSKRGCPTLDCKGKPIPANTGDGSIDRYTIIFTGNFRGREGRCYYVASGSFPTHPQGFYQHGESDVIIDVGKSGFPPGMGDLNHLGRRIPFKVLPVEVKKLIRSEYKEIWNLN